MALLFKETKVPSRCPDSEQVTKTFYKLSFLLHTELRIYIAAWAEEGPTPCQRWATENLKIPAWFLSIPLDCK